MLSFPKRRGAKTAFVCLTLALSLWPSALRAQLTAPREAAQIQMGPLSIYPTLRITDAGKDRNIFNDEENPKEDFTFTVASRALAVLKAGLNEVMFSTGNDYVWFRDFAEERSSNTRYAGRANLSVGAFKPFVGFDRQHTRSRPSPEIDARALRLDRSVVAGFSLSTADRTAIIASAMVDDTTYATGQLYRGSNLGDALNRAGRSMSAGIRYKITPLTSLAVNANYGEDTFPDSHIRDAKSYSVVPALEFSPDAAIRGRFGIGVEKFQPLDVTLPASLGAVYDANLNWSIFGRTTFDLTGSRDTRYSYQDSQPYFVVTGARLNVAQHLFGPIDLLGAAEREHLAYRWHRGVALDASLDSTNTLTDLSAGVGVNIGRSVRFTVTADRTERRSPRNPRQNFNRTRVLSSVTIGS